MAPDALFTTHHQRFNTRACPIQDPHAFVVDVRECADQSSGVDTFYMKLAERRDQRVRELERAWSEVGSLMSSARLSDPDCGHPGCCKSREGHESDPHSTSINDTRWHRWAAFGHLSRTMSFDNLIAFFDGFVRDRRQRNQDERSRCISTSLGGRHNQELGRGDANVVAGEDTTPQVAGAEPAPQQAAAGPPCSPLSPKSTASGGTDTIQIVDAKAPLNPTVAAGSHSTSPPSSHSPSPPRILEKISVDGRPQTVTASRKRARSVPEKSLYVIKEDAASSGAPTSKKWRTSPGPSEEQSVARDPRRTPDQGQTRLNDNDTGAP
jgi:hypothetical protein